MNSEEEQGKDYDTENRRSEMIDGRELVSHLSDRDLERRLQITGVDDETVETLREMRDILDEYKDPAADNFYDVLQSYEHTDEVLNRSSRDLDGLKKQQKGYIMDWAKEDIDRDYFESRARIGKIHDMIDMGLPTYVLGFALYDEEIIPGITETVESQLMEEIDVDEETEEEISEAFNTIRDYTIAYTKIKNLDLQIGGEAYERSLKKDLRAEIKNQRQASAEISGEISNLSASIEEVASTANDVAEQSKNAEKAAEEGVELGNETLAQVQSLQGQSALVGEKVEELETNIGEISEINEKINEIAEQTNMLALNAQIEAARAGEEGDGFAVVAEEVKSLAEEAQGYASEVEQVVNQVEGSSNETIDKIDDVLEDVSESAESVEEVTDVLEDIKQGVAQVNDGIQQVAEATDDQAESTEQVAATMDQLDREEEEF